MKRSQPQPSLASRLRRLLVSMLLLPLLAGTCFFLLYSARALRESAVSDLNAALALQSLFVERWVGERTTQVDILSHDPRSLSLSTEALNALLRDMRERSAGFTDLLVVDERGVSRASAQGVTGLDLADREYFLAARQGKAFVSDLLVSRNDGSRTFVVSSPLRDASGAFRGAVVGTVSLEALSTLMRTVQANSASRTFLTQADGTLLAPAGAGPGLRRGDVLFDRASERQATSGTYRAADGKRVVGTYRWVLDGKWLLAGERPESEILATHAWVLGVPLAAALGVFLIFGPAALRLARSLREPMRQLEEHAMRIQAGDYEMGCLQPPPDGAPEEVRRLSQAYCQMVDRVRGAMGELKQASLTDPLTGASNRKMLYHEGPRLVEAARRAGQPVSLLMLDLDHFKVVNDTHGHATGDAVLVAFSSLLHSTLRKSDLFVRFGGEEFVVLAPNAPAAAAVSLGERIRASVERLALPTGQGELKFTVSVGVATLGPEATGDPLERLINGADVALYAAKNAGRNRVEEAPPLPSR